MKHDYNLFRTLVNYYSSDSNISCILQVGSTNDSSDKANDIDLLIVTEEFKPIEQQISLLPLNIHATDVRYKDFMQMLKSKELTAVSEAIKKNIILIGIEEYYRLINNANR